MTRINHDWKCVYVMFREDGTPFYVGKGRYNRPKNHLYEAKSEKNSYKLNTIRKLLKTIGEVPTVIIKDELTDEEACFIEIAFIKAIGRFDLGKGPLANKTDGGEGATGYKFTPQQRATVVRVWADPVVWEKHSAAMTRVWKDPEVKARQSASIKETMSDPDWKVKASEIQKIAQNVPKTRLKRSKSIREALALPTAKANQRAAQKIAQSKPEVNLRRSASILATLQDPLVIERRRVNSLAARADPEWRKNFRAIHKAAANTPEAKAKRDARWVEIKAERAAAKDKVS